MLPGDDAGFVAITRRRGTGMRGLMNGLKKLLNPRVIVPTLLSAALLVFVLTFANAHNVGGDIATAMLRAVLPVALLALLYLAVKGIQWYLYLARLDIRPDWKDLVVPYAGGEMSATLPLGVYLETYLLKGTMGTDIGRSAAATTWMLITEVIACLLALLALGVPGWLWVRPLAGGLIVGMVLVGWVLFKSALVRRSLDHWQARWRLIQPAVRELKQFIDGGNQLFSWRTIVYGLPLALIYLGAYATMLYVIGAILIPGFRWTEAVTAFAFSLLGVLLVPVLPQLGSVEAAGLEVMLQLGVNRDQAVSSFLSMRLLSTGTIILACGITLILLHSKVGEALRHLSGAP